MTSWGSARRRSEYLEAWGLLFVVVVYRMETACVCPDAGRPQPLKYTYTAHTQTPLVASA